ncbi:MAG: sulfatase-like hydrolase/transferase, partial [Rubrivivax sp.]
QVIDAAAAAEQPFFIQCSFPDPHHPFSVPGRYWDMYRPEDVELPESFALAAGQPVPSHVAWLHRQRDAGKAIKNSPMMFACTEREAREAIALNYGSIQHIDDAIGRVLAHLNAKGLERDTVVVFTSDHGDYLGDHQLLWKGPIHYQSLIRTPFIWHDPAMPKRATSDALCSTIDIAPTILERAGLEAYHGIQGESLLPLVSGERERVRDKVLIEEEGQRIFLGFDTRVRMRTLQTDRHRLSVYDGVRWGELYDLLEDPHEMRNLWDEPKLAALRAELISELTYSMLGYTDTSPMSTALA